MKIIIVGWVIFLQSFGPTTRIGGLSGGTPSNTVRPNSPMYGLPASSASYRLRVGSGKSLELPKGTLLRFPVFGSMIGSYGPLSTTIPLLNGSGSSLAGSGPLTSHPYFFSTLSKSSAKKLASPSFGWYTMTTVPLGALRNISSAFRPTDPSRFPNESREFDSGSLGFCGFLTLFE